MSGGKKGGFVPPFCHFAGHLVSIKRLLDSKFIKLATKVLSLQIHFVDSSSRRSLPAPGDEFFDTFGSPFGDDLH